MSENPQPKKPQRKSGTKVVINNKKRWQDIVNHVDKKEVPIEVLQQIIVKLIDGTNITINIRELLENGQDPTEIEGLLNDKFSDLDPYIENVDFFVDIDKVVDTIQPETEKVLKGL